MQHPRWKRWLSYLVELELEQTHSVHNDDLIVTLRNGRHVLNTAHAIYSYDDLYRNFAQTFEQLPLKAWSPQRILVLGLGLGSIPFMLEKRFKLDAHYTVVDIDEEIIRLAEKYTFSRISSPVTYICADALAFVNQCTEQFDLVAVDLFLDDQVPEEFETAEFLEDCKRLLSNKGLVVFNRLARSQEDLNKTEPYYWNVFKKVFPKGSYIKTSGNWMLLNKTLEIIKADAP